ncbi:MAG TPA: adenylate/guanylate cyclase domain-containing protein [Balneolaceae bacterium]|nr:adenylate/guanylate cyclase domain-containing protein [Balneolaceae bacterium]
MPEQLWPLVSDTDAIFKALRLQAVKKNQITQPKNKHLLEISSDQLSSFILWEQEPYIWEQPFRFGTTRYYKSGFLKKFRYLVDLTQNKKGTLVRTRLWITPDKKIFFAFAKYILERYLKTRYDALLQQFDRCAKENKMPYEFNTPKMLGRSAEKKIYKAEKELLTKTRRKRIIDHLVQYIRRADDAELHQIHPFLLAEHWGEKKYSVLNVFLHGAHIELLDYKWEVYCPGCKQPHYSFKNLRTCDTELHCPECDTSYSMDFNLNTQLVFSPHPTVRKLSDRKYSIGDPQETPHKVSQHFMRAKETMYLKVWLEEGTYIFKSDAHEGELILHARDNAVDTVTITLTEDDFKGQEVVISTKPNITLINKTEHRLVCNLEKKDWKKEATYASEVSSAHDFRSLFPMEALDEEVQVKASGVTMLFTDLLNSTEIYSKEGDDFAIGRVMSHFKIIEQIVAEERGGIVKTIGDSVMAVFREPVSALKAVERIQQIFTFSTAMGSSFKIKAGVHFGDCTAVNLNGRTDYFGTTVNIASRLVDVAKEKEIVISDDVFQHPDVQLYLDKRKDHLFVKESAIELKGFKDKEFKIKQIRLERPSLRLVV